MSELGIFLRARRARVTPSDVGLPEGIGLRRTPGLRREELATLAGVSIDYYTRLEQGKETRPSPAVVDALAATLRLNDDEQEHLRGLAAASAQRAPERRKPVPARTVRPGVHQLLEALRPNPAYVVSRTNDILAANPGGYRLLAGIEEWPAGQRNILRFFFLHPGARALYPEWEKLAPGVAARLRAMAGTYADAPDLVELVGELAVKSPEFARLWKQYDVEARVDGHKRFHHPEVGDVTLGYESMTLARTEEQRLIAYHAEPGSPAYDAMVLLDMASPRAQAESSYETPGRSELR
ncbi:helix-turn-helix transcriptional regulator [Streptomyces sp. NBC_01465]|uniref:helix-turn-helix transcriptional regulator n=1 Tax=Streptomyces sp. NBC_01465 TaxID=2903878 RepID=UPI002E2EDA4E|nr:helix-turn-helix transcriptional regulator [Streptomyces sp. NBC_01465]